MRKILSIVFYHIGHTADRLLWFNSPTYEWAEDSLGNLYQWAMWQSVQFDDYYEIWQPNYKVK